jgi:hypothetical protein
VGETNGRSGASLGSSAIVRPKAAADLFLNFRNQLDEQVETGGR